MSDWIVRVYEDEAVIDAWVIKDRTEQEAFGEAEPDVSGVYPRVGGDWTLTELDWEEGGNLKIALGVDIWIEMHPEAIGDVLQGEIHSHRDELFDPDELEREIGEVIVQHLVERKVSGHEIDAFEEWLDDRACSLVNVAVFVR